MGEADLAVGQRRFYSCEMFMIESRSEKKEDGLRGFEKKSAALSSVLTSRTVHRDLSLLDLVAHEEVTPRDMFGSTMVLRVVREVERGLAVCLETGQAGDVGFVEAEAALPAGPPATHAADAPARRAAKPNRTTTNASNVNALHRAKGAAQPPRRRRRGRPRVRLLRDRRRGGADVAPRAALRRPQPTFRVQRSRWPFTPPLGPRANRPKSVVKPNVGSPRCARRL